MQTHMYDILQHGGCLQICSDIPQYALLALGLYGTKRAYLLSAVLPAA